MSGICWPSIRDNHHGNRGRADPYFLWRGVRCLRGSHDLSARRARRTKSRGPKGPQLEVGARRAPRLLLFYNGCRKWMLPCGATLACKIPLVNHELFIIQIKYCFTMKCLKYFNSLKIAQMIWSCLLLALIFYGAMVVVVVVGGYSLRQGSRMRLGVTAKLGCIWK